MKRPSKLNGDEANRSLLAGGQLSASSPRPAAGETENFIPLGMPVQAVVMRLKGNFPKIRVPAGYAEPGAPPADQSARPGEEDRVGR